MKGIELAALAEGLSKVPFKHRHKPAATIGDVDRKLGKWKEYLLREYDPNFSFRDHYYRLSAEMLEGFSFDELCKLRYSSTVMMCEPVEKLFRDVLPYAVVAKIGSSMWRWGVSEGTWNEVVESYERIRRFSLPEHPDFGILLDYAPGCCPYGYGERSGVYLDGALAFLLCLEGEHVLTLGFSIMGGRRLLLQQVQSARRRGNRGLYRLPANRLEFAVELFRRNFPGYTVYVADGESLADKIISGYRGSLERSRESLARYEGYSLGPHGVARYADTVESLRKDCAGFEERIAHLEARKPRLASAYGDAGRFSLGATLEVNGLVHRQVMPLPAVRPAGAALLRPA